MQKNNRTIIQEQQNSSYWGVCPSASSAFSALLPINSSQATKNLSTEFTRKIRVNSRDSCHSRLTCSSP